MGYSIATPQRQHRAVELHDVFEILECFHRMRFDRISQGSPARNRQIKSLILLDLPIDSVMYFLSTTGGVVPVDSDLERD